MTSKTKKIIKYVAITLLALVTALGVFVFIMYNTLIKPNTNLKERVTYSLYIHTDATFDDVVKTLEKDSVLLNINSFVNVSKREEYDNNVKPGRFLINEGMNNRQIVRVLSGGLQSPVNVTFSYSRYLEKIASKVSKQIEADSASIMDKYNDDSFIKSLDIKGRSKYTLVVPNTYEFYWNTSAEGFWKRMKLESDRFWNESRLKKAEMTGLTVDEVVTLASIVELETSKNDEKARIAGVYMNRLKKGIPLQADPTLAYLIDWNAKRILNQHKQIDSPYNTYMYKGLPPGPICFPATATIDAVLNYEVHNYLYFCAKSDFSGYHSFSTTYTQHLLNAKSYHDALNGR